MFPSFAYSLTAILFSALAFGVFCYLAWKWVVAIRNERRGWRLRASTPGRWMYEEKIGGEWKGIPLEEQTDVQEPPYVIVAPSQETWSTFPGWAAGRRMEILARVRSEAKIRRFVIEGLDEGPARAGFRESGGFSGNGPSRS